METKEKQGDLARERSMVLQLESDLQHRERQENAASPDRGVQGGVPGPALRTTNRHLKADLDSGRRERRLLQGQVHSWQQERGKERRLLA